MNNKSNMFYGTLVHETIEDIHNAAIRGETNQITPENIQLWFETNYGALVKAEHTYLDPKTQAAALKQVQRYAEKRNGKWEDIQRAEVDVSLVKPDYIIDGKIDLIKGDNNTVEIVDFKSEKKPDVVKAKERLECYRHGRGKMVKFGNVNANENHEDQPPFLKSDTVISTSDYHRRLD